MESAKPFLSQGTMCQWTPLYPEFEVNLYALMWWKMEKHKAELKTEAEK